MMTKVIWSSSNSSTCCILQICRERSTQQWESRHRMLDHVLAFYTQDQPNSYASLYLQSCTSSAISSFWSTNALEHFEEQASISSPFSMLFVMLGCCLLCFHSVSVPTSEECMISSCLKLRERRYKTFVYGINRPENMTPIRTCTWTNSQSRYTSVFYVEFFSA